MNRTFHVWKLYLTSWDNAINQINLEINLFFCAVASAPAPLARYLHTTPLGEYLFASLAPTARGVTSFGPLRHFLGISHHSPFVRIVPRISCSPASVRRTRDIAPVSALRGVTSFGPLRHFLGISHHSPFVRIVPRISCSPASVRRTRDIAPVSALGPHCRDIA